MGFSLKKLGRGIKKVVKKNKGGLGRLVKKVGPGLVMAAAGGSIAAPLIAKAASKAKSIGAKVRGLETPKSLASVVKAAEIRTGRKRSRMPGGAPMPTIAPVRVRSITRSTPQAKGSLYTTAKKPKKTRAKKAPKTPKVRKPPSAAQLAAREKFKAMVAARRKKAA